MKTSFLGQAYASRSPILASQTAINIYPEMAETGGSEVGGFYGTPGLVRKFTGTGEVRGLWAAGGKLYAVIGATVWRIDSSFAGTDLGDLPQSAGPVSIVDNGSQIAFAHSTGWHWVTFTGTAIAAVTNSPAGSVLATQDNYVLYTNSIADLWGITALANLSSVNPLDVASAEGAPDTLNSILSSHREAWLFGDTTTEPWANTGAALFPFERAPGGFIEQGCAAKFSPAELDNSPFWLGRDENGKGVVYRANAYTPVRISTHALEYAIRTYSDISDAIGFAYQEEGHSFYWLTFPSGDASWVYDVASGGWHQRASMDANGLLHRHRANCYTNFNGAHLVGDFANGQIYQMTLNAYDDAGDVIYRERAWDLPDNEGKKIRGDYLKISALTGDGEAGGAPIMVLEVSQDGGRRWGYERFQTLGNLGQHTARARWRRLGAGRNTSYRVSTTMRNRISWVGAVWRGEALGQ